MSLKIKPKWTLIFLLSARNNLFNDQLKVIKEIYSIGSSKDIDFVILFDGIEGDKFSKKFAAPSIYHANKNTDFLSDVSFYQLPFTAKGLTNKKNLEKLLKIAVKEFQADNYGFIYKGHGGPATTDISKGTFVTKLVTVDPKMKDNVIEKKYESAETGWSFEGFCEYPMFSKNSVRKRPILLIYSRGNTKSLLYSELADTLATVFRKKLGFICMDCCWAQQIENANKFVGLTDYFIASADEMPTLGLGYSHLCNHFINRPRIRAEEVANLLVSIYYYTNYADYDTDPEYKKMGVSLTSLSLLNFKPFIDSFRSLCNYLIDKLKNKHDQTYVLLRNARNQCLDYTYKDTDKLTASQIDYPMFNIDLIWLLENLLYYNIDLPLDNKIFDVINQLQNNLIAGSMRNNYQKRPPGSRAIGGNGVAICFPANKEHAKESILKDNKIAFFKTTGWRELLNNYYNYKFDERKLSAKGGPVFKGLTIEKSLAEEPEHLIFKKAKHKNKSKRVRKTLV